MNFDKDMARLQVSWRKKNVKSKRHGYQNGVQRAWILPSSRWEEGLWTNIRSGTKYCVTDYLAANNVSRHGGSHNLKSSWVAGVNLYFPFGQSEVSRDLLARFLRRHVDERVESVDSVELEYAEAGDLSPENALGEPGGSRGTGQTSPDIAFVVNGRTGLLLVENKLTEHSFYACSARTTEPSEVRLPNPDVTRCDRVRELATDLSLCHHRTWGRKYWVQLQDAVDQKRLSELSRCPAATAGYQLFRQQALAEAIAKSERYEFVISVVALDQRNQRLAASMRGCGLGDVREWGTLFKGKATFAVFAHQAWVGWVRANDSAGDWSAWAKWIDERYGI